MGRYDGCICMECEKEVNKPTYRYNKTLCIKCLPKVLSRVRDKNEKDIEYIKRLRRHYGLD